MDRIVEIGEKVRVTFFTIVDERTTIQCVAEKQIQKRKVNAV